MSLYVARCGISPVVVLVVQTLCCSSATACLSEMVRARSQVACKTLVSLLEAERLQLVAHGSGWEQGTSSQGPRSPQFESLLHYRQNLVSILDAHVVLAKSHRKHNKRKMAHASKQHKQKSKVK